MSITLVSTNPNHYNRITASIPNINLNGMVNMIATNFISMSHIQILNETDYISFGIDELIIKIYMDNKTQIEPNSFITYVVTKIHEYTEDINIGLTEDERYVFLSETPFTIEYMSYNLKQIFGLYYVRSNSQSSYAKANSFPLIPTNVNSIYSYKCLGVGYANSTPLLYLVSNLGSDSFLNNTNHETINSMAILMRIHNSFIHSQPIISSNGSFISKIPASALGNLNMILVDANRVEIKILSPIYVTLEIEPIIEENPFINITLPSYHPYMDQNLQTDKSKTDVESSQ